MDIVREKVKAEAARDNWIVPGFYITAFVLFVFLFVIPVFLSLLSNIISSLSSDTLVFLSTIPPQFLMLLGGLAGPVLVSGGGTLFRLKLGKFSFSAFKGTLFCATWGIPLIMVVNLVFNLFLREVGVTVNPFIFKIINDSSWVGFSFLFVTALFIAPLSEEIIFRRIIFSFLCPYTGALAAVVTTSFFFALIHQNLVHLPGLFILGILLQRLYIKYDSLYPAVFLHFLQNAVSMGMIIFLKSFIKA